MSFAVTWIIKAQDQFTATSNKISQAMTDLESKSNRINAALSRLETTQKKLGTVGKKMSALVTAPLVGLSTVALKDAASFQQLQVSFSSLFGSAKEGNAELEKLKAFARGGVFKFFEVADAARALKGAGIETKALIPDLRIIGDVAAGTGTDFNQLAFVFAKVQAQGRLMGNDVRLLTSRGINLYKQISKMSGKSVEEVQKAISAGALTAPVFIKVMEAMTKKGGMFYNQMEKQLGTLTGSTNKLKESTELFNITLGTVIDQTFGVTAAIRKAAKFLDEMEKKLAGILQSSDPATRKMLRMVVLSAGALAALGPGLLLLKGIVKTVIFLVSPLRYLRVAFLGLSAAMRLAFMNPLGLLITFGATLLMLFLRTQQGRMFFKQTFGDLLQLLKEIAPIMKFIIKAVDFLIKKIIAFAKHIKSAFAGISRISEEVRTMGVTRTLASEVPAVQKVLDKREGARMLGRSAFDPLGLKTIDTARTANSVAPAKAAQSNIKMDVSFQKLPDGSFVPMVKSVKNTGHKVDLNVGRNMKEAT